MSIQKVLFPLDWWGVEVSGNEDDMRVFPHLAWFWWASPRNKYEALFKFFLKYDEEVHFMIYADKGGEADRICSHLSELKILRKIGFSRNWSVGKETTLYEGKA